MQSKVPQLMSKSCVSLVCPLVVGTNEPRSALSGKSSAKDGLQYTRKDQEKCFPGYGTFNICDIYK